MSVNGKMFAANYASMSFKRKMFATYSAYVSVNWNLFAHHSANVSANCKSFALYQASVSAEGLNFYMLFHSRNYSLYPLYPLIFSGHIAGINITVNNVQVIIYPKYLCRKFTRTGKFIKINICNN